MPQPRLGCRLPQKRSKYSFFARGCLCVCATNRRKSLQMNEFVAEISLRALAGSKRCNVARWGQGKGGSWRDGTSRQVLRAVRASHACFMRCSTFCRRRMNAKTQLGSKWVPDLPISSRKARSTGMAGR